MRPNVNELKAVRTGIGAAVRALHSEVLREAVPDRIAELLRQVDQLLQVGEAHSRCDSACRQLTHRDLGASAVVATLFAAPKEPMASMVERRTGPPSETIWCDMVKIRQFSADAAAHCARFAAAAVCSRVATTNRVAATREAIAQSRALLGKVSAVLANDDVRTGWPPKGWLWPSY
jgi:hypothetical protein